jgi:hypothetical protein
MVSSIKWVLSLGLTKVIGAVSEDAVESLLFSGGKVDYLFQG